MRISLNELPAELAAYAAQLKESENIEANHRVGALMALDERVLTDYQERTMAYVEFWEAAVRFPEMWREREAEIDCWILDSQALLPHLDEKAASWLRPLIEEVREIASETYPARLASYQGRILSKPITYLRVVA